MTMEGGGLAFDWNVLVPRVVHPLKVAIIEALRWIHTPLSASDLTKVIDADEFGLSHVSYHLGKLADAGAVELVRKRQVRGSTEKFYFFP
jgi:DNA-binding transcriptional ArsR family regulator